MTRVDAKFRQAEPSSTTVRANARSSTRRHVACDPGKDGNREEGRLEAFGQGNERVGTDVRRQAGYGCLHVVLCDSRMRAALNVRELIRL